MKKEGRAVCQHYNDKRYQSDELCNQEAAACIQGTGWDQESIPMAHHWLKELMMKHDHPWRFSWTHTVIE